MFFKSSFIVNCWNERKQVANALENAISQAGGTRRLDLFGGQGCAVLPITSQRLTVITQKRCRIGQAGALFRKSFTVAAGAGVATNIHEVHGKYAGLDSGEENNRAVMGVFQVARVVCNMRRSAIGNRVQ